MSASARAEVGFSLVEVLVVLAILAAATLCAAALPGGGHAGRRSATMVELVGLLDHAHGIAAGNGATLEVAPDPAGPGSTVALYDAFTAGTVVLTMTTPERLGAFCTGPACRGGAVGQSFRLRIRRDGSFDGDVGWGLVGAQTLTIGISDQNGVKEAFTLDTSDLHAPFTENP